MEALWAIHDVVVASLAEHAANYVRENYMRDGFGKEEMRASVFQAAIQNTHLLEPLVQEIVKHTAERLKGEK